jgi:hypothetical protein
VVNVKNFGGIYKHGYGNGILLDGRICSVSGDGSLKIWNLEVGVCELSIDARSDLFKVIQLHDGRLVVSIAVG